MRPDGVGGGGGASAPAAVAILDELLDRLRSVEPGSLSNNDLTAVARRARGIERAAAALVATVGAEANRRREQADPAAKAAARAAAGADGGVAGSDGGGEPAGAGGVGAERDGAGTGAGAGAGQGSGGAEDALRDPTVSARQARLEVRRAEIAHRFPGFGAAVARGSVSVEHLDVLYWAVDPLSAEVVALLLERSVHLVAKAERHPPRQFAKVLRALIDTLCSVAADELAGAQRAASELLFWRSADGMGHFRGTLDPERFNLLVNEVEAKASAMVRAAERDGLTLPRSANLNATALIALVTRPDSGGGSDRRPLIHLLVDAKTVTDGPHEETVCETVDGDPVPLTLLGQYAYRAVIQAVVLGDDGLPLHVGRQYRSATSAQWAALTSLYCHCGWPGCDQPISRCQAHHLRFWEDGGPTDFDNLVPLCRHHHAMVHHGGWQLRLGAGRRLHVTSPNGELFASAWPNRLPARATSSGSGDTPNENTSNDDTDLDRASPTARSGRSDDHDDPEDTRDRGERLGREPP